MAVNAIPAPAPPGEIPMPIIRMTHWTLLTGILLGFVLQQPLVTTALLFLLLPGMLFGLRASVPIHVGRRLDGRGRAPRRRWRAAAVAQEHQRRRAARPAPTGGTRGAADPLTLG